MSTPSADRPIRLAVVGTEHGHSRALQETLSQIPAVRIVSVLDDGGTLHAPLHDLPRYHDLDALLAGEPFDAAMVTVSPDRAEAVLVRLAAAGKHLFCDKPVCRSAAEMRRVADAVARHGVRFAAGYHTRFRPVHLRARELIRQGRLGTLFALQASLFTTSVAARGGAGRYPFQRARSGGGVLGWEACHLIDMILDLAGRPVAGVGSFLANLGGNPIDVEDVGSLTIQFEGGTVACLLAGYTMPRNIDDPRRFSQKDTALSVWGSRAKLELEPFGTLLEIVDYEAGAGEAVRRVHTLPYAMTPGYVGALGRDMMEDFIASIVEERPPRADQGAALGVLEVLDAAYRTRIEVGRADSAPS